MFARFLCALGLALWFGGAGCATQQQKDFQFVQSRVAQLRGLEKYPSTVCEIETIPTPTALARYIQLNPKEAGQLKDVTWKFKWRQTENHCEISGESKLQAARMQKGIVEAAFCLPLQVFFINSPFDEVVIRPEAIRREGELIQVSDAPGSHLGYYLDTGNTTVRTRTQSKGELSAHYSQVDGEWLPDSIEQNTPALKILLDGVSYSTQKMGNRRLIESMWISIGTDEARRHSQISIRNCQSM